MENHNYSHSSTSGVTIVANKNPLLKKYEVRYQTAYKTPNCSPNFTIIVEAVGGGGMACEQVYAMFGGRDNCKIHGWKQIN